MFRKTVLTTLLFLAFTAFFTACDDAAAMSYAPSAYGESGHCYYAYDPAEVIALQQSGLCPRTWKPMIMPVYWHSMYYMYYDSPSYYDLSIPVASRTYYHKTVVHRYETEHKS